MPKAVALARRFVSGDFARDGAIVFAATMSVNVFNYIFHFFMTRYLGPISYGGLSSLLALTALLSLPAAVLTMVVVKYASELHAVGDRQRLRRLAERVFSISGAAAAIIFFGCVLASGGISQYLHVEDRVTVWLVGLIVAVGLMNPALRGVLQGTQDFASLAIAIGSEGLGKCVLGIAFAAGGLGLRGALIGYAAGCIVSLMYAMYTLSSYRRVPSADLHLDVRRLLHAMLGIAIATVATQFAGYFDVILVKHYFSASDAGIYSAVALAGKSVIFFVGFIPSIVLPKAAARASQGLRATSVLLQGLGLSAAMSVGVLAVMWAFPAIIMRVFSGTAYLSGAHLLPAYALAMTFLAGATTVANYQIGLHRFHFVTPVVAFVALEVGAIAMFHSTLYDVLITLVVGNAALLASTFYVPGSVRLAHARQVRAESAAATR